MSARPSEQEVFQALADPTRRSILRLLAGAELPITAIAARFSLSRTAINKHLHLLASAGLLARRQAGRETLYTLQAGPLLAVQQWLNFYEQYWDESLTALKKFVEKNSGQE